MQRLVPGGLLAKLRPVFAVQMITIASGPGLGVHWLMLMPGLGAWIVIGWSFHSFRFSWSLPDGHRSLLLGGTQQVGRVKAHLGPLDGIQIFLLRLLNQTIQKIRTRVGVTEAAARFTTSSRSTTPTTAGSSS